MKDIFVNIPNFPIAGFNFPDITPLFEETNLFNNIIDFYTNEFAISPPNYILCIESFGYLFGAPLAYNLGSRILLCRKAGRLPRASLSQQYDMCYDKNRTLEIHDKIIRPDQTVLIIDDFLASGGTSKAACDLVRRAGGKVIGIRFVAEIVDMGGIDILDALSYSVESIFKIRFEQFQNKWTVLSAKISIEC